MSSTEEYITKKDRIWLDVNKVRREGNVVSVQLKGDKEDREANWWPIKATIETYIAIGKAKVAEQKEKHKEAEKTASDLFHKLSGGLEKGHSLMARLEMFGETEHYLVCTDFRIQSSDSNR